VLALTACSPATHDGLPCNADAEGAESETHLD